MSLDPAGGALMNPMGGDGKPRSEYSMVESLNWYSYVSNNPVKYVDPSGEEIVVTGDKEFKNEVQQALDKITSEPKGREMVESLRNSENIHEIVETEKDNYMMPDNNYEPDGDGTGSTIFYNPEDMDGGMNEEGSDERPPFVGLAHELGHAETVDDGTLDIDFGDKKPKTIPPIEENSMRRENEIRREHDIPLRPYYY